MITFAEEARLMLDAIDAEEKAAARTFALTEAQILQVKWQGWNEARNAILRKAVEHQEAGRMAWVGMLDTSNPSALNWKEAAGLENDDDTV